MTITLYPNSIVYFFSTLFAAGMILIIYLQKNGAGTKLLAASISALNLEMFAMLVESIVKTIPQKIFWSQIEHIGYAAAPTLLLFFALRYTQPNKKFSPFFLIGAWIVPLINTALVWTNARHHLVWTGFVYDDPAVNHLSYLHGIWYWFFLAYTILVFLLVNLVFLKASLRSGEKKRKQYRLLMSGNLIPLVFGLIYGAGWVPLRHLNLFALGSLIACLVIWLAVKKYQFLDPDPIARIKLVSSLPDGVVVLNAQQRVVSANPAAEKTHTGKDHSG